MKKTFYSTMVFVISFSLIFGGCSSKRVTNSEDTAISGNQSASAVACYGALKDSKPDMSKWTPEQIMNHELIAKLGDALKMANKISLDPCAGAGGKNVYDAEMEVAKQDTEQAKAWLGFGESLMTKVLYGYIAHEAFSYLKGAGSGNSTVTGDNNNLTGNQNDVGRDFNLQNTSTTTTNKDAFNDSSTKNGDSALGVTPPAEEPIL